MSIRSSTNKQIFLFLSGSMFDFVFEKNKRIGSLKYACSSLNDVNLQLVFLLQVVMAT